jgi:hypothetical protein
VVRDVDHAEITTDLCLAERDPRAFATRPVCNGTFQDVSALVFVDVVLIDVRFAGRRVDEKPKNHMVMVDPSSQGFELARDV